MKNMKLKIFLLISFLSFNLFAQLTKTKILHVTVDISESYAEVFMYKTIDHNIDHFEWKITHINDPDEQDTFTVEDIRNGTVFTSGIANEFVTIVSDNFSEVYGGNVSIRYPYNAVSNNYLTEEFEMARSEDLWPIDHSTFKNFTRVHITINRILGVPVGVYQVEYLN